MVKLLRVGSHFDARVLMASPRLLCVASHVNGKMEGFWNKYQNLQMDVVLMRMKSKKQEHDQKNKLTSHHQTIVPIE